MRRRLTCIVIGAGMSGILAAIRLRERGDDVVVLEKGSTVGGTWRENRYAGLTCDVPAHAYTYSFAPNPEWSRYFAAGHEIQRYFEDVVDRHGIRDAIRFGAEVVEAAWRDSRWHVEVGDGSRYEADVLIAATGVLHHPRHPDISGLETFAGEAFHSARWPDGIDMAGKRIGVIGNGSTGVQIVSALAGVASHVYHFQRSPQWIMPVQDFAYTDEERARFRADPAAIDAIRFDPEYVGNVRRFNNAIIDPTSEAMGFIEAIVSQHLEASIADPVLRAKLTPDYRAACKRLIFSPSYYVQVQRDDVEVVRDGIERIEPGGVRTRDGTLHRCDVLVYATGFHADRFIRPINVIGRDGVSLNDFWARRPTAFLALMVPDMPNLFLLNGPTGPVGNFSLIEIAEAQWGYIAQLIDLIERGDAQEISPTYEAMADYEARRIAAAKTTIFASGCSSWYLDAEGVPQSWPWSYDRFFEEMREPDLSAYDVRTGATVSHEAGADA